MKKVKVLIADDNRDLLSSLEIQLLVHGYEVVTCTNADLAVAYAQKHQPDVMLVDIWMDAENRMIVNMAGNGFGVLERIKKLPEISGIPVVYITGADSRQLDLRAQQLGAYGLIHKPIIFGELLKTIEAAVKDNPRSGAAVVAGEGNSECQAGSATCDLADVHKVA
jgi:two-component system, sensor histidine kinase and response regulator